jgi:hypothetical protein
MLCEPMTSLVFPYETRSDDVHFQTSVRLQIWSGEETGVWKMLVYGLRRYSERGRVRRRMHVDAVDGIQSLNNS